MFQQLGRFTASHPWMVCAAWLVVGSALTLAAPAWDTRAQDDDVRFLPDRCPSVRGHQLLARAFPQDISASRLIFAVERPDATLTEDDFALVDRLTEDLEQLRQKAPELKIGTISSYQDGL